MKKGSCPKLNFYQFQFLIFSIIFKPSSLKLNRSLQTRKLCEHFLSYVYKYPRVWIQEETDLLIQVSGYGEIRLSSYGQGHNHHTKSQLKKTSKKTPKVYVQLSGQDLMWRRESKVDLIDVLCFLTSFCNIRAGFSSIAVSLLSCRSLWCRSFDMLGMDLMSSVPKK